MKTKQAKDFLVQQADEQAAQEGVPLSDIEKMYFTESNTTSCNPRELNDEFEAMRSAMLCVGLLVMVRVSKNRPTVRK